MEQNLSGDQDACIFIVARSTPLLPYPAVTGGRFGGRDLENDINAS